MKVSESNYEYPSPKMLTGKAARYINIPASLIFDLQTDAKDLATFTFLSVKRSVDDSVTFSLTDDLVKWNGFVPSRQPNGINHKFIDSLEKLTGTLRVPQDVYIENLCFAKVLRSPNAHANIL